jgi:hypothetical protein
MTTETALNQLDRFTDIDRHFADFLSAVRRTHDRRLWLSGSSCQPTQRSLAMSASIWLRSRESQSPVEDARTPRVHSCLLDSSEWMSALKAVRGGGSDLAIFDRWCWMRQTAFITLRLLEV